MSRNHTGPGLLYSGAEVANATVIAPGAPARYLIPSDGGLSDTWTLPGFDDSLWGTGTADAGDLAVQDVPHQQV